jgi:type II secretory pathway pseudopilin PulG
MTAVQWVYLVGSVITIILAIIAAIMVYKAARVQRDQRKKCEQEQAAGEKALQERKAWLNKSIHVLAQALQHDELTPTEASIRICGLLDALAVSDDVQDEFSAFYQLRARTHHIPFLEAWAALEKKQQQAFDVERLHAEAELHELVVDAAVRIQGRTF